MTDPQKSLLALVRTVARERGRGAQTEIARTCGVERSSVTRWLSGESGMDGAQALRLLVWLERAGGREALGLALSAIAAATPGGEVEGRRSKVEGRRRLGASS